MYTSLSDPHVVRHINGYVVKNIHVRSEIGSNNNPDGSAHRNKIKVNIEMKGYQHGTAFAGSSCLYTKYNRKYLSGPLVYDHM